MIRSVSPLCHWLPLRTTIMCRLRLKCDDTQEETRFRLPAKRTSPFKSAGASVQSTTSSRGVRISGSKAGYTMFRGSAKSTGYPLHSPVSPSLPLPCVTVCHHISTGLYTLDTVHVDSLPACALSCSQNSARSRWPHAEQGLQAALECQVEAKEVSCHHSEL